MSQSSMPRIREVWAPNLEVEMRNIRALVDQYPFVAMDTEFPGVVARPIGTFKSPGEYHYQTMRSNVDMLKPIQVGITLADADGKFPPDAATWQFNFEFDINEDMYAPESVELLQNSGIDFQRHLEMGIMPNDFAELMITSGLVLSDETTWMSFHSGYDFGYIIRILSGSPLPTLESAFFEVIQLWFPKTYDLKHIVRINDGGLKGGLQQVADDLGIPRVGPSHTAGSDSLLTASTFFKMRELYFGENGVRESEYNCKLYGLGPVVNYPSSSTDLARGGVTIAERDDRGHSAQAHALGMGMGPLGPGMGVGGAMAAPQGQYGPMGAGAAYMRAAIGQR